MFIKISHIFIFTSILIYFFFSTADLHAAVLFHDDFEDGNSDGWEEIVNHCGGWSIGTMLGETFYNGTQTNCSNPSFAIRTYAGSEEWKNYDFEFRVKGVSGIDKAAIFYSNSDKGLYGVNIRTFPNQLQSDIILQRNGVILASPKFNSQLNTWYLVKISVLNTENGVNIEVFVADMVTPKISVTDSSANQINSGRIGFAVWPGEPVPTIPFGSTIALFDDVSVTSNSIPPLNLPISYTNRGEDGESEEEFKTAFWSRLNSSFDHNFEEGTFLNYKGESYSYEDCLDGLTCYDGHAGIDFSRRTPTSNDAVEVFAAADGEVVFSSEDFDKGNGNSPKKCQNDSRGFGCAVIIKHDFEDYPDLYTLYGHLYEIDENASESGSFVGEEDKIATMGETGKALGKHLHFSVFKGDPLNNEIGFNSFKKMSKSDWQAIINQISFEPLQSYCTYRAPNGLVFHPVDPNGWSGEGEDPWLTSCNQENEYLWKYPTSL